MRNKPSLKRSIIVQYKIILMDSMYPIFMPTFIAMLTKVTILIFFLNLSWNNNRSIGQKPISNMRSIEPKQPIVANLWKEN